MTEVRTRAPRAPWTLKLAEMLSLARTEAASSSDPAVRAALQRELEAIRRRIDEALDAEARGEPLSAGQRLRDAEASVVALREAGHGAAVALAERFAFEPPAPGASIESRVAALESALGWIAWASRSGGARRGARALRATGAVIAASLLLFATRVWLSHLPLRATASASRGGPHDADQAVDRDFASNWLLPDRTPGWIAVAFAPRVVTVVRIFNVRGVPGRAAGRCVVRVMNGAEEVERVAINLAPLVGPRVIPAYVLLDRPARADSVGVYVQDYLGEGGGLAEIEVE